LAVRVVAVGGCRWWLPLVVAVGGCRCTCTGSCRACRACLALFYCRCTGTDSVRSRLALSSVLFFSTASFLLPGTGFCFTDFGEKWETFDETGEPGLMRAVTGMFNSNTIDEVIAEESAFVSKFEKEIDELGSINDDTEDSTKNKYNSLMESLQRQRLEVNKLKELKVMMKDDETIVVLDREQADLRIDQDNDNESFFTLEGVKGMEHTKKAGINVNNAGLWKVGPQGTLLVVVGGFWSLVVCKHSMVLVWPLVYVSRLIFLFNPFPHTPHPSPQ
jgi:hypothetical protein